MITNYYDIQAVSHSMLKAFDKSPKHALHFLTKEGRKPTSSMLTGTAVHLYAFERERFVKEVAECPSRATKEGKAFAEANKEKLLLTPKEFETVAEMGKAFEGSELAKEEAFFVEQYLSFKIGEVECKAKIDLFTKDGVLYDLKTTDDASNAKFARMAYFEKYARQLTFYRMALLANGHEVNMCKIFAIENKPPYVTNTFILTREVIEECEAEIKAKVAEIAKCIDSNVWPGYEYYNSGLNFINNVQKYEYPL